MKQLMIYYTISKEDEKEIRMLVFDKSVTLFDKLKEYDKESLKLYGSDLGLTKLSKFRKDELVQKVVDKLWRECSMDQPHIVRMSRMI